MSPRRPLLFIAMVFLIGWSVVPAAAEEETKVTARLVAGTSEFEPGSTFWLGVHFEIEDGWHIYWRNPGGAGLATAVHFELPDGFTAGPLQWPLPIAFVQSEGIPGYGYEASVVLAAEVSVPRDFDRSQLSTVRAETSWLACKGVCVLGSAEIAASLTELGEDPVFRNWAGQLPGSFSGKDLPFTVSVTGGLSEGAITHWLRWAGEPGTVEWFPDPAEALEVGDVRIQTRGGLTRIDAAVKSRKGASGSTSELPSLLVVTGDDGERRGWELTAKLTND
ncbi:MAG: protein-disulfide reductase DsbD family protein [Thermoanaerobaculales bacterium]|nr:protein-disulfide reductase DsbD family protein [Thermoanaerobaculales bacterium]